MHGPSELLVLIATGTPANQDTITTTLRDAGFAVAVATSAEAALELAHAERSRNDRDLERQVTERTAELTRELRVREEELREARAQIERELSTPLIPITDRIMVMPMIGMMTEERADELLDTALRGVQTHNADVVIIDVTGMKLLDSKVAGSLLETASALRLLGAQAVITGIRPDLAQTLTTLGVDLGDIVTRGTLKSGIAYALRRSGTADRRLAREEPPR